MIKLVDVINLCGVTLEDFKIHFATICKSDPDNPPLDAFYSGEFKEWQEGQTRQNFQCQQIVSLIHLDERDRWLFAGVFRVCGNPQLYKQGKEVWYQYSTKEVNGLESLTGRAIVKFAKPFRACYLLGEKYINELLVAELREDRMSINEFPGHKEALLSYDLLRTVVRKADPSWKSALSNVSGIYLITDTHTGKHYVGKASGGEGIWQRWIAYAKNGHGGNKELRDVLQSKGEDYVKHFQYSILEVFGLDASKDYACARETHWKNALQSREFGYNIN